MPPLVSPGHENRARISPVAGGDDLRELMRLWPHGVRSSRRQRRDRMGVTVSSLVSLSLEPPLVGDLRRQAASCYELLRQAGGFAVSMLGSDQEAIARQFASSLPPIVHWEGVAIREGQIAPLIEGALGWIEARTVAEHDVGDHTFFVGDVDRCRAGSVDELARVPGSRVPRRCDRSRRLRPRRRADRVRGGLGRGARGLRARARRPLRRRDPAGDDGHELARVVALPARDRGIAGVAEAINPEVVQRMLERYREPPPLRRGGRRGAPARRRFPLAVASSSNRPLIDAVLELAGSRGASGRRSPPRRSRAGSPRPTSTSRRRAGSVSRRRAAPRSRTRTTASVRRRRRACASSRSRIRAIRRTRSAHSGRRRDPLARRAHSRSSSSLPESA